MLPLVKRLPRILLNAATALSLALCVATAVLWVRSGRGDFVVRGTRGGAYTLAFSVGGELGLYRASHCPFDIRPQWRVGVHRSSNATPAEFVTGPDGGLWLAPRQDGAGAIRTLPIRTAGGGTRWAAPHAVLVAVFAALAVIRPATVLIRTARAGGRRRRNCCPACGYDLRATPDRCPECGRVPEATPANAAQPANAGDRRRGQNFSW